MPTPKVVPVRQLSLDLHNFRTVPQQSELGAIRAMVSINPEWFWALAESILTDGYHITENILLLQSGNGEGQLVVKEGNRRIAVLKLILGYVRRTQLGIPSHIEEQIVNVTAQWRKENKTVPCAVYTDAERAAVDKIVSLTHGKGEKAGRDKWKAVARSRHAREFNGSSEPALDLLERYLKHGTNLTPQQKERWSGDYPLSVLDDAIKRLAPRFGAQSTRGLADSYPKSVPHRRKLEEMLKDIALESLTFSDIRNKTVDFALTRYGIPDISSPPEASAASRKTSNKPAQTTDGEEDGRNGSAGSRTATAVAAKSRAAAVGDPRSVIRQLKAFTPLGKNREKVVTLLIEASKLKLHSHPHAFCFLLRSMFEISAKAYCNDHKNAGGPTATNAKGDDRTLVDVLRDVTKHLTNQNKDKARTKALHGAMTELGKPTGFLSVTSMNQLIHNPKFSVSDRDISVLFGNIFPLLEAMNS